MSKISITTKNPAASCHYPAAEAARTGATDVEIDIAIVGTVSGTNGVTLAPDGPAVGYIVTQVVECEGESVQGLYSTEAEAITAAVALAVVDDDQVTYHEVSRWCGEETTMVWDSDRPYVRWG